MTKIGLIQFLLLFLISAAFGQKVKYKDIYALLSAKQFEQAEPFLKQYLRQNVDNPNAFLFMGNIFEEKASRSDVLRQTSIAIANMDSARLYYDKAYKILDEREVRRNKGYYEAYKRRDLRTGEFGVKLSDIQFDIGKKIEGLKERSEKLGMARHFLSLADSTYTRANAHFVSIQRKYPSKNQLFLRADKQTVEDLSTLSLRFDSCLKAFDLYKSTLSSLGRTGYNQKISLSEVADFAKDGTETPDFYQDEIKLSDYKGFAEHCRQVIEKEILPMRKQLVSYDMAINKLRRKLDTDSVSVRNDVIGLVDKLLYDQLKKYDAEPLPISLFALKTTDLEYRSALLEHKSLRDSADLHLQISMVSRELALLSRVDSMATVLPEEKLMEKSLDYAEFISDTYGAPAVLKSYIHTLGDFAVRERKRKNDLLAAYQNALKYIVDGVDSIPLGADATRNFKPLILNPEKFTMGISLKDTTQVQGYFYSITASRKPELKAYFPLAKNLCNTRNISSAKALGYSDAAGQIYYLLIYNDNAFQEKFPATLAKIYRSDGLAWKIDQPLAFTPTELVVSAETGELFIRDGEAEVVVDKNGRVR